MKTAILTLLIVGAVAAFAWLFRYEYLPPVEHVDDPTLGIRSSRSMVVCTADRWTRYISCNTIAIDAKRIVEDTERRLREWKEKQNGR